MTVYLVVTSAPLLVQFSLGIMLPAISDDLVLSDFEQGMLGSVAWFGTLVLYIPLSAWLSRFSPIKVTSATALFGVGAILVQVYAVDFGFTLLGRFLLVLPTIATGPARTTLIQQWFRDGEVATVNGLSIAAMGVTEIIAIWVSPFLIEAVGGWREALLVYGVVNVVALVAWMVIAREHPHHDVALVTAGQSSGSALRATLRRADVWWILVAGVGSAITWSSFFTFWPTYAVDTLQLNLQTAGFIWGLGSVSLTLVSFFAGPISRRFGRKPPIITSFLLNVPTFLAMLSTDNVLLLSVFALLMGASWFFIPILNTVPFELPSIRPREVAMAWALFMVASNLGTTIGPLLTGALAEAHGSFGMPLVYVNIFMAVSIIAALFLPETGRGRGRLHVVRGESEGSPAA